MDPFTMMMIAQGIGAAGKGVAGLFGNKNKNSPGNAANDQLDKIPGMTKPYFDPYMQSGQKNLSDLNGEYDTSVNNPNDIYNRLANGYKESPGYQMRLKNALQLGENASARGGMLGTPYDQEQAMGIGTDIASQDYEKYLEHMFGIYNQGISGKQGLENQGFDATTDYASLIAAIQGQKANNAAGGQDWQNRQNAANWSNIFGGAGAAAGGYFGDKYGDKNMPNAAKSVGSYWQQ